MQQCAQVDKMEPCRPWRYSLHTQDGGRWQPSAPRAGAGSATVAVRGYFQRSVHGYSLGACSLGPLGGRGWYTFWAGSSLPRERLVRFQSSSFKIFSLSPLPNFATPFSSSFIYSSYLSYRTPLTPPKLFSFTIFLLFSPIFLHFLPFHFRSPIDSLSRVRFFAHFTLSPPLLFY